MGSFSHATTDRQLDPSWSSFTRRGMFSQLRAGSCEQCVHASQLHTPAPPHVLYPPGPPPAPRPGGTNDFHVRNRHDSQLSRNPQNNVLGESGQCMQFCMVSRLINTGHDPQGWGQMASACWNARAVLPAGLHEQDLGLEASRCPLRWLQPMVCYGGHVVLGPRFIAQVVHQCHLLKHMQRHCLSMCWVLRRAICIVQSMADSQTKQPTVLYC